MTNLSLSKLRDYLLSRSAVRFDIRLEAKSQSKMKIDFDLLIRLGGGGGVMGCLALGPNAAGLTAFSPGSWRARPRALILLKLVTR